MKGIGKRLLRTWQAAILLLALAITLGSLLPMPELKSAAGLDKLQHLVAYFALALLGSGIVEPPRLWRVMVRCFLFGLAIELLQALGNAGRSADWVDLAANGAGILAAWLVAGGGRAGWARHVDARLRRLTPP